MPITKKECAWSTCKEEFHGTDRRKYCHNTCKNKQWRLDKAAKLDKQGEGE
tara:strand:+ start:225 stop:377 length:153 start_codon:yes stop_codon:yes gene_type:complete